MNKMEDIVKGKSLFRSLAVTLPVLISLSLVFTTSCSSSKPTTTTPPVTTTPPATAPLVTTAPPVMPLIIIDIADPGFYPQTLTVAVGTTVTWVNLSYDVHNVTSDTGLFNSPLRDNSSEPINSSLSYTFTEPGTFSYHCSFHSDEIGRVIVE